MKKPAWMCGEAESWNRMKSGMSVLSVAGKMRENVGKTFAGEVGLGAGVALAAALDRVLAVRAELTAKAKIAVEAESRVISEGPSKTSKVKFG